MILKVCYELFDYHYSLRCGRSSFGDGQFWHHLSHTSISLCSRSRSHLSALVPSLIVLSTLLHTLILILTSSHQRHLRPSRLHHPSQRPFGPLLRHVRHNPLRRWLLTLGNRHSRPLHLQPIPPERPNQAYRYVLWPWSTSAWRPRRIPHLPVQRPRQVSRLPL